MLAGCAARELGAVPHMGGACTHASSRGGGGANEAEGAIVQMSSEEVRCSGRRE